MTIEDFEDSIPHKYYLRKLSEQKYIFLKCALIGIIYGIIATFLTNSYIGVNYTFTNALFVYFFGMMGTYINLISFHFIFERRKIKEFKSLNSIQKEEFIKPFLEKEIKSLNSSITYAEEGIKKYEKDIDTCNQRINDFTQYKF